LYIETTKACALPQQGAKPPGTKNEKWGCWGAVRPKNGQKSRVSFWILPHIAAKSKKNGQEPR